MRFGEVPARCREIKWLRWSWGWTKNGTESFPFNLVGHDCNDQSDAGHEHIKYLVDFKEMGWTITELMMQWLISISKQYDRYRCIRDMTAVNIHDMTSL